MTVLTLSVLALPSHAVFLVTKQPFVSKYTLESMSGEMIQERYPQGIKVTNKDVPEDLRHKLKELEKKGYSVKWDKPDYERLQTHTFYVIRKNRFLYYFSNMFADNASCSPFFRHQFLDHTLKLSPAINITCLNELSSIPVTSYSNALKNHPHWDNLGFTGMIAAPQEVSAWLNQTAKEAESLLQMALKKCRIKLSPEHLSEISKLVVLQYLNDSVNGLFYQSNASPLTYYRKRAVDSLGGHIE